MLTFLKPISTQEDLEHALKLAQDESTAISHQLQKLTKSLVNQQNAATRQLDALTKCIKRMQDTKTELLTAQLDYQGEMDISHELRLALNAAKQRVTPSPTPFTHNLPDGQADTPQRLGIRRRTLSSGCTSNKGIYHKVRVRLQN